MKTDAPSPAASPKHTETVGTDCDTNYTTLLREFPTTSLAGNSDRIAPVFNFKAQTKLYSPDNRKDAASKSRKGRLTNCESLSRYNSGSATSLPELFLNANNKRGRDRDISGASNRSPPTKLSRSTSSPPKLKEDEHRTPHNADSNMGENTKSCESLDELLRRMEIWRTEDKAQLTTQLAAFKEEIATQISTASQVNHEEIQEIKTALAAENESLKKEISALKERITTLDLTRELSSLGENADQSTPNPSSGLANMLDEQIRKTTRETLDKLARKNNVIIKGLNCQLGTPSRTASDFFTKQFKLTNCVSEAIVIGKDKDRIKVTLKDHAAKKAIMSGKKNINAPIYINNDLTREEQLIAKKLRDASKEFKKEGKRVKLHHQSITVDGNRYKYDLSKQLLVPAQNNDANTMQTDPGQGTSSLSNSKNGGANMDVSNPAQGTSKATQYKLCWKKDKKNNYKHQMAWSPRITCDLAHSHTDILCDNLCSAILDAASECQLMHTVHTNSKRVYHKPWYNNECAAAKAAVKSSLAQCKAALQPWSSYHDIKAKYYSLLKDRRSDFDLQIRKKFRNVRNATEFWLKKRDNKRPRSLKRTLPQRSEKANM
ncbi:hypothetical protein KQX54_003385 [Cotesia glomerata]|uniref:Uncharacterized protein n=1 Tax=Cotesia glomerata TaxID=32391 RepID=A0AAV7IQD4_COTGL|nr:hypothetical protein KQX54_003385 [Cotesia glomerata]